MVTICVADLSCFAFAENNSEKIYSQVVSDWSKREAATSSLELVFSLRQVHEVPVKGNDPNEKVSVELPQENSRILFSGRKFRRDGSLLNLTSSEPKTEPLIEAANTKDHRSLIASAASGSIQDKDFPHYGIVTIAVGYVFRGIQATDIEDAEWKIEDESTVCDGVSCTGVALQDKVVATAFNVCWVDLARRSLPMRHESRFNGNLVQQIDLHYDKAGQLSHWEYRWPGTTSGFAKVVTLKTNIKINDSEFEIEFPKGYRVADVRKHTQLESLGGERYRPWVGRSATKQTASANVVKSRWQLVTGLLVSVFVGLVIVVLYRRNYEKG